MLRLAYCQARLLPAQLRSHHCLLYPFACNCHRQLQRRKPGRHLQRRCGSTAQRAAAALLRAGAEASDMFGASQLRLAHYSAHYERRRGRTGRGAGGGAQASSPPAGPVGQEAAAVAGEGCTAWRRLHLSHTPALGEARERAAVACRLGASRLKLLPPVMPCRSRKSCARCWSSMRRSGGCTWHPKVRAAAAAAACRCQPSLLCSRRNTVASWRLCGLLREAPAGECQIAAEPGAASTAPP